MEVASFNEHSESEFLVSTIEALRKNLALKCNAKRSGGVSLVTVLDARFGHVPDDWRVSAGYHEKGRQGSHVRPNVSYMLKVHEFTDVWSGLKHLGAREHGELSGPWSEL